VAPRPRSPLGSWAIESWAYAPEPGGSASAQAPLAGGLRTSGDVSYIGSVGEMSDIGSVATDQYPGQPGEPPSRLHGMLDRVRTLLSPLAPPRWRDPGSALRVMNPGQRAEVDKPILLRTL
jgi:hypothetical protein